MATFSSYQHTPFPLDSIFQPDSPISLKNMSGFMEEGFLNNINSCFAQISPPEHANEAALHVEGAQLDRSSKLAAGATSDNEPSSVTKKQSTDQSSTVVDKHESTDKGTHKVTPMDKKRNNNSSWSSLNSAQSKDAREGRSKRQKKSNGEAKEEENKPRAGKKDQKKVPEEPPTGYIHVRARRGQATDSHSLAERVRREKISERMKILQRLVPGCDKVTGKALMLDEIINYVLSLQNQVEFLSTKLASINPLFYEFGMDPGAFMVRPERLSNIESPLPPMQHCSPTQPTAFVDANSSMATATTVAATAYGTENSYPIMDSSLSVLLQGQRPIDFTQDASLLWDLEEQRQKFLLNPSWFSNNLSSFH